MRFDAFVRIDLGGTGKNRFIYIRVVATCLCGCLALHWSVQEGCVFSEEQEAP